MPDEIGLERGHGDLLRGDRGGKTLDEVDGGGREESLKNSAELVVIGQADVNLAVDATWPNERRVEPLGVIGSGKEDAALARGHAVQGVQ